MCSWPTGSLPPRGSTPDLAFADPPYDFDDWPRLLRAVRADLVVAEAPTQIGAPDDWEQGRVKRYGRTWVTFLHRG